MRTFAEKPEAIQQATSATPTVPSQAHFGPGRDAGSIWVVTELDDEGEPCSQSAWTWVHNGKKVRTSGPGKGSASPVLSGQTANQSKQPC